MKRILYLAFIISGIFLSSCTLGDREMGKEGQVKEGTDEKTDGNAGAKEEDSVDVQYPEVVDGTGERRLLKFGDVSTKDKGYHFYYGMSFASDYSQVVDDHYYYLRVDGSRNYTVYRDKGEKAVGFTVERGCYVAAFIKYGEAFYAFLEMDEIDWVESPTCSTLVRIDGKTGEISEVWNMEEETAGKGLYRASFYQDSLYYEDHYGEGRYDTRSGRMAGIRLDRPAGEKQFLFSFRMGELGDRPDLVFMDGRIYYGLQQERRVTLYSYDLVGGREEEVFCYDRADSEWGAVGEIKADKDYIYCQDYIIPRAGGKMKKVKQAAASSLTFNSRYIFYTDTKSRLHRISRDLRKDDVICDDIEISGIDSTEEGIYISEHNKAWDEQDDAETWDNWGDPRSGNLYYMDFDGKNRKKLWNEVLQVKH